MYHVMYFIAKRSNTVKLFRTHLLIPAVATILMLLVSACGSSTTTGSSSTSAQNTPTATATQVPPTPTQSNTTTSSAVVQTATTTVNGKSETILTDTHGMTLYYFTLDTATTAACTGGCASTWPPLLYSGSSTPTSATTLSGTLAAATNANGKQVLYNNHFLYTFSGDTAPGQTNGEGIAGKWFVATSSLGGTKSASGY